MFDDFDDNEPGGEDFYSNTDIEETLSKYKRLEQGDAVFFTEEEIETLSYHFFLNHQHKDQLKIVDHGLYLYPGKVELLIEKATVLSMENRYEEALACTLQARESEPYNALVHKVEGEILCDLDRAGEAEECFRLALQYSEYEDDEFVIDVYINYAQMLIQDNRLEKANRIIEKALVQFPDNELLFNQLAMNFISGSLFIEAIRYFKQHIDTNPYSHLAWYHLGRFYELTHQKKQALNAYEYSGLANKESKNAFFSLGGLLESRDEFESAIENYQQSIKNNGDLYPYICIARCYLGLENAVMARTYLKKAKDLEDMLPEYHYLIGYSHLAEKDALKALPYFKKVYKEDKNDFAALKGIMSCYSELERNKEIETIYFNMKADNQELLLENWKEFASVLYMSEMDDLMNDLFLDVRSKAEFLDALEGVLNVIKYDQQPSKINKDRVISRLIHNFDDTIESVKLFCQYMYDEDEEFRHMMALYQNEQEEDEQ